MKAWRARYYLLSLGRTRKLVITVRRFQTAKVNRSKAFRQLVLPCQIGSVKEVALRIDTHRRKRRTAARTNPSNHWRRVMASAPFSVLLLGIAGSAFFGQQVFRSHSVIPPKTFTSASVTKPTTPTVQPLTASIPITLSIPAVNINAPITPVGQAANGSIQMPPILDWETGWYKYSPTPGQLGPAVIVGHVDNYESIWVFWRLRYVQPGDDIYITRQDGTTVHFKVTALKQFSQADFPTQQVYGNINYPGLRLITCGGTFSNSTEEYNENTVVYASMVS
jgi:sortase (surface protein transpeptidase)